MIKILIVDDHAIVRYGTMHLIKQAYPSTSIADAENLDQMIKYLNDDQFDILILDINIPGGNSLQMMDIVRMRQPKIRILIFSAYDEQLYAIRYLQSGADGYLNKNAPESELRIAINLLINGEKYISSAVKEYLLSNMEENRTAANDNPLHNLSNREIEVLQSLVSGLTLAEIGARLNLGISTVSTYKQRIFDKLKISNMVELIEKVRLYNTGSIIMRVAS